MHVFFSRTYEFQAASFESSFYFLETLLLHGQRLGEEEKKQRKKIRVHNHGSTEILGKCENASASQIQIARGSSGDP